MHTRSATAKNRSSCNVANQYVKGRDKAHAGKRLIKPMQPCKKLRAVEHEDPCNHWSSKLLRVTCPSIQALFAADSRGRGQPSSYTACTGSEPHFQRKLTLAACLAADELQYSKFPVCDHQPTTPTSCG
ncbi:hypothetical protein Dimus_037707 [Dionaea muscipula]